MAKVESPCVRNCCLDGNDICMGCFRSLTEITQWTLVDEKTKKDFLRNIAVRKLKSNHGFLNNQLGCSPP